MKRSWVRTRYLVHITCSGSFLPTTDTRSNVSITSGTDSVTASSTTALRRFRFRRQSANGYDSRGTKQFFPLG